MISKFRFFLLVFLLFCIATNTNVHAMNLGSSQKSFMISDDKQAKRIVDEQIRIFIKRAPEIFEVEYNLVDESNPIILAYSMVKLNMLFSKYDFFVDGLVKFHEKGGTKFRLGFAQGDDLDSYAEANMAGIRLNRVYHSMNIDDYKALLLKDKKDGITCSCDDDNILYYVISHEVGHIIRSANVFLICDKKGIAEKRFITNHDAVQRTIRNIAGYKYGFLGSISDYGRTDANECFAEVFAHLECSKSPNGLGLAMRDFLSGQEDFLKH